MFGNQNYVHYKGATWNGGHFCSKTSTILQKCPLNDMIAFVYERQIEWEDRAVQKF